MRPRLNIRTYQLKLSGLWMLFGPGAFLMLLGIAVLFAPRLVIAILAAFFLFLGAAAIYLAIRFIELKRVLLKTVRDLKSRVSMNGVSIHGVAVPGDRSGDKVQVESEIVLADGELDESVRAAITRLRSEKKIVFH